MSSAVSPPLQRGKPLDSKRYHWQAMPLLLPTLILLLGLFLIPIGYAGYLGLTNLQLIGPHALNYRFTGTWNFHRLGRDSEFLHSLLLTIEFVVGAGAFASTAGGLVLALLMEKADPALRTLVGALAMLACILPPATVAVVWFAVSTAGGVLPYLTGNANRDLLYDFPMTVVSLANAWSLCGMSMLMFSAGLKNIPQDMYEAASLEGATASQSFLRITLPMLRPTIMTSVLLMTLLSFGNFTLVFMMTGGGPQNATNILPIYSYMQGFRFENLGYAAMLGNVMVLLAALLGGAFVYAESLSTRSKKQG